MLATTILTGGRASGEAGSWDGSVVVVVADHVGEHMG